MDENLPAVLLMGGGEGMGPIEATARALGDALYDESLGEAVGQVLIICGRNKKLQTRLSSLDWKIPVQVALKNKINILRHSIQCKSLNGFLLCHRLRGL